MKIFSKIVNGFYSWTILLKNSIIDVWQGPKYSFYLVVLIFGKPVPLTTFTLSSPLLIENWEQTTFFWVHTSWYFEQRIQFLEDE